jgi:ABC-2 type transport system ATP-binding protein
MPEIMPETRKMTDTTDALPIRIEHLSKIFGRRAGRRVTAVNDLSLRIEPRQVYGFLGPNGAGKTTTIRMILNLMRPSQGSIAVFGQPVQQFPEVLRKLGALVEGPAFYPFLNGRGNLEVLARTAGDYNLKRINELLDMVDLIKAARQPYKSYSLGMKQRLGIAAALLSDPPLLILDEPTNGLDPAGIQEIRHLIRRLVDDLGKTVFLSSHLLSEVEQVCDRVAIINKGVLLREGRVSDLLDEHQRARVETSVSPTQLDVLSPHWQVTPNEKAAYLDAKREDIPRIIRMLTEQNIDIYHISSERRSLEEYFLDVTSQKQEA